MTDKYKLATPLKRILAWFVDLGVLILALLMVTAVVMYLHSGWLVMILLVLYALFKVNYWTLSTTFGKRIMGLKIVNRVTGGNLTLLEMLRRQTVGKFLSLIILNMGVIWILLDPNSQGWHDKMVDSIVIECGGNAHGRSNGKLQL